MKLIKTDAYKMGTRKVTFETWETTAGNLTVIVKDPQFIVSSSADVFDVSVKGASKIKRRLTMTGFTH